MPFLALFMTSLVDQVQPLSLLLNGITTLFAAFGFARSRLVDWRRALGLVAVTTVAVLVGAWMAHPVDPTAIWALYLASVAYLAYRLFRPVKERPGWENSQAVLAWAVPISVLSGLLGVGPGFLLMPTLILAGFETKRAAAINAIAVTPPVVLRPAAHLPTAQWDGGLTLALLAVGAVGAVVGARISSVYVPDQRIKQLFGVLIVAMTTYKIITMLV